MPSPKFGLEFLKNILKCIVLSNRSILIDEFITW